MKKLVSFLTFCLALPLASASGSDVLIVQSFHVKPYDDAVYSLKNTCLANTNIIFASDMNRGDIINEIRLNRPDVIVAIGADALGKVSRIHDIPIVYLMVLNPDPLVGDSTNTTGIRMSVAPDRQLAALQKIIPHVKKVGVLYDCEKTAAWVRKANAAAKTLEMDLALREISSSREVPTTLNGLKGKVQALWLVPDTTVINQKTFDFLLLFSLENKIPLVTFSPKYLEMGAFMSVDLDPSRVGKQAGEIVNRILAGADVRHIPAADAIGGIITVNMKVAKKLGITINETANSSLHLLR